MTTTISRLYDNYSDAQAAVSRLEAAGVPHSDISIVANNSDGWFKEAAKARSIAIGTVSMTVPKAPARAPASARASAAQQACLRAWSCSRSRALVRLLLRAGLRRLLRAPRPGRPPVASSAR